MLKRDGEFNLDTRLRLKKFLGENEEGLRTKREKPLKGNGFGKGSVRALQRFLRQQGGPKAANLECTGAVNPATITALRVFLNSRKAVHGMKVNLPPRNTCSTMEDAANSRTIKVLQAFLNGIDNPGSGGSATPSPKVAAAKTKPPSQSALPAHKQVELRPDSGGLGMELEEFCIQGYDGLARVLDFYKSDDGRTLPAEASGAIDKGDVLVAVNNTVISKSDQYADTMARLANAVQAGGPIVLAFNKRVGATDSISAKAVQQKQEAPKNAHASDSDEEQPPPPMPRYTTKPRKLSLSKPKHSVSKNAPPPAAPPRPSKVAVAKSKLDAAAAKLHEHLASVDRARARLLDLEKEHASVEAKKKTAVQEERYDDAMELKSEALRLEENIETARAASDAHDTTTLLRGDVERAQMELKAREQEEEQARKLQEAEEKQRQEDEQKRQAAEENRRRAAEEKQRQQEADRQREHEEQARAKVVAEALQREQAVAAAAAASQKPTPPPRPSADSKSKLKLKTIPRPAAGRVPTASAVIGTRKKPEPALPATNQRTSELEGEARDGHTAGDRLERAWNRVIEATLQAPKPGHSVCVTVVGDSSSAAVFSAECMIARQDTLQRCANVQWLQARQQLLISKSQAVAGLRQAVVQQFTAIRNSADDHAATSAASQAVALVMQCDAEIEELLESAKACEEQLVAQRNALDERGEDFSEKVARENPPSCNSASALEAANQVGSAVRDKVFWDKAAAAMATEDRTQEDVATLAHALVRLSGSATEAAYVIPVLEEAAEDFTVAKAEADAAEQAAAAAELVAKKNDLQERISQLQLKQSQVQNQKKKAVELEDFDIALACKQKLIDISKELREAHEAFEALSLNHSIAVVETARPEAERQASEAAEQLHKDLAMQHEEDKLVEEQRERERLALEKEKERLQNEIATLALLKKEAARNEDYDAAHDYKLKIDQLSQQLQAHIN